MWMILCTWNQKDDDCDIAKKKNQDASVVVHFWEVTFCSFRQQGGMNPPPPLSLLNLYVDYIYKPLVLVSNVLYFADRSVYFVARSLYLFDWSLYLVKRSLFLATTSSTFLSSAWIWDWSKSGSFNKILFSAIACAMKITRNIMAAILVMFQYIADV